MPEINNLPETVDAAQVGTKVIDLLEGTPAAGVLPPWTDSLVVGRSDNLVMVIFAKSPSSPEDVVLGTFADAAEAEVQFVNALDTLRRDGWTLRDPEPWELPDPLADDAPVTF